MRNLSGIKEVREVSLSDKRAVAELIQKGWEPLDVFMTYKRLLWWERVDYIVMFGQRGSGATALHPDDTTEGGESTWQM